MSVDWDAQWALHSPHFKGDRVHLDFVALGFTRTPTWRNSGIELAPGPGFGDLSHPTTRLVLTLMHCLVAEKKVLDLGSGSGVLALAAAALGANEVLGIDIDPEAVIHARKNALSNNFEDFCTFSLPQKRIDGYSILLMNMIRTEQETAMQCARHVPFEHIFTSGILAEERDIYLTQTRAWGWHCIEEASEDSWLGFHFLSGM